jgi:hypothetical protein
MKFRDYLKETKGAPNNKTIYDDIKDEKSLKQLMKRLGKEDNLIRTISITFGQVAIYTHRIPSELGPASVAGAPFGYEGYWKNGKLIPFSDKLINKYQNQGLSRG